MPHMIQAFSLEIWSAVKSHCFDFCFFYLISVKSMLLSHTCLIFFAFFLTFAKSVWSVPYMPYMIWASSLENWSVVKAHCFDFCFFYLMSVKSVPLSHTCLIFFDFFLTFAKSVWSVPYMPYMIWASSLQNWSVVKTHCFVFRFFYLMSMKSVPLSQTCFF